jgi:D-sedoheptulose 7-phosphate isomerase
VKSTVLDKYRDSLAHALGSIPLETVESIVDLLENARDHSKRVFIIGNGGSAATASHMVCDLSKSTLRPGKPRLRVVPFTDNVPLITAWANDTGYENIFTEQLESLAQPGDVLIALSGSGNSENIIRAVRRAKEMPLKTVGLTGFQGGALKDAVELCIVVNSTNYGQIEDVHHSIGHMMAEALAER